MAFDISIATTDVLVKQCMDGNMSAYRLLYERYNKAMFNTALRIVNSVPDAEDILQESFTDAFIGLRSFENRSTFGAWLKRIVIFKSITFLKNQRLSFTDMGMVVGFAADEDTYDESDVLYTVENIKQVMQKMPDGYRTVLSLYLFEGYDHDEIALILDVAKSTVRTQYIRAKQKLLQMLKENEVYEQ